jgi:hypothetical protein
MKEFASAIDTSYRTWQNWEDGTRKTPRLTIFFIDLLWQKVVETYGVKYIGMNKKERMEVISEIVGRG